MLFLKWTGRYGSTVAAIIILTAAFTSAGWAQEQGKFSEELFNSIQRDMICLCGCKSILKDCPHVNCDYAIPARKKIKQMLIEGKTREDILAEFVRERGEQALAAPPKKGFNILGYVLPFVAIIAAGYGVAILAMRWAGGARARETAAREKDFGTGAAADDGAREQPAGEMAERLKKELEEFDS